MKIKKILLDRKGLPETVTVSMNLRELAFINRMIGKTSGQSRGAIQTDGGTVGSDIYDATCDVIHRFWDDGVNGIAQ